MICCSIMKALLTEYSSTAQSANLGLSLEYHAECKRGFEVRSTIFFIPEIASTLEMLIFLS